MPRKRNRYISAAQERCLRYLAIPPGDPDPEVEGGEADGYMIQEGLDVWYGHHRTSARLVMALFRHCLISEREASHGVHIYMINEDGHGVLNDVNYVPRIDRPNYGEPLCPSCGFTFYVVNDCVDPFHWLTAKPVEPPSGAALPPA